MKRSLTAVLLACLMACSLAKAQAQTATPAPQAEPTRTSTSAAQVQDIDPNSLLRAAAKMAIMVDSNRTGELWDNGSQVAKQASTRDAFVAQVAKNREGLGLVAVQRTWVDVRRQEVPADKKSKVPPGVYATVEFVTVFAQNKIAREMISLRLEAEGRWYFTGYAIK